MQRIDRFCVQHVLRRHALCLPAASQKSCLLARRLRGWRQIQLCLPGARLMAGLAILLSPS